jgi:hypothetical protein
MKLVISRGHCSWLYKETGIRAPLWSRSAAILKRVPKNSGDRRLSPHGPSPLTLYHQARDSMIRHGSRLGAE